VLPTFYNDKAKWTQMMKSSIETNIEKFATKRMLTEYYERLYKLEGNGYNPAVAIQSTVLV
jgi:glucan phosphorylase